jgi:hypothetical protein
MEEIQRQSGAADTPLPHQYFDLIGGTSTGGLIALMLGRMRMVSLFIMLLTRNVVCRRMCYEVHGVKRESLQP